ncbi:hypothetical protein [Mesorhizobium sp. WSM1293]|uniref:hypothetical protein n=1 Tax=Mesorhizobium sp. WSM1293 TaxID=1040984 RepID=UPI0004810AB2|nr:hypothetical protein [Mesorhizobium sp. WSM1293]
MTTQQRLAHGTRVIDRDGFIGSICNTTDHDGSFWYDVRFERGDAVRYPRDLRVVIDDFPAYAIVDDKDRKYLDGETIAVPFKSARHGILYSFYQLGSVAAYAVKNGDDVEAAIARARSLGHKLHYAFGLATSLTAWERPKEIVPGFDIGDTIRFAGKLFRIERAPNQNIGLVEVEPVSA